MNPSAGRPRRFWAVCLVVASACAPDLSESPAAEAPLDPVGPCTIGSIRMLTGTLAAAESHAFVLPRTSAWSLPLQWMAEDGALLKEGEPAVEFDASTLHTRRIDGERDLEHSLLELEIRRAEIAVARIEREAAVERARVDLERTTLRAAVSQSDTSQRAWAELQLARTKAQAAFEVATEDGRVQEEAERLDIEARVVSLDALRSQIEQAAHEAASLQMRAPQDGLFIIANHPNEPRKVRVGDALFPGTVVANLPTASGHRVDAFLSEADDGAVRGGEPVTVVLDAWPELAFAGKVARVAPMARPWPVGGRRKAFETRIALDTHDERHRPGMGARVEILTRHEAARCVDRAAIRWLNEGPVDADGAPLRIGTCDTWRCEVQDGFALGQRPRRATP